MSKADEFLIMNQALPYGDSATNMLAEVIAETVFKHNELVLSIYPEELSTWPCRAMANYQTVDNTTAIVTIGMKCRHEHGHSGPHEFSVDQEF